MRMARDAQEACTQICDLTHSLIWCNEQARCAAKGTEYYPGRYEQDVYADASGNRPNGGGEKEASRIDRQQQISRQAWTHTRAPSMAVTDTTHGRRRWYASSSDTVAAFTSADARIDARLATSAAARSFASTAAADLVFSAASSAKYASRRGLVLPLLLLAFAAEAWASLPSPAIPDPSALAVSLTVADRTRSK
jgi:hypothetical protein